MNGVLACFGLVLALGCGGPADDASPSSISVSSIPASAPDGLAFRVCNNGYQPVARVEFEAVTFAAGDATPRPVGSPLVADSVLPQANCADFNYSGPFSVLDSVAGRVTTVTLAREGR